MANHLIIGLGGTGGKVIRELRKRVYEEFRSNDPGNGVNLDYIYVDSSPADLNDRTSWKVMGKGVHLGEAQKVSINGINTSMLQNLNLYPGLQSFISPQDKKLIDAHMGPLITAGIGGQRRRLGRILMASNLCDRNSNSNFTAVLHGAVNRLQNTADGDRDVTFHICAGLAGGTGSGSIVDVIAQIRKAYPYQESTHAFKIRLFLYMPERNMVFMDHDSGFYQANGYAALQELNAISTGHYYPLDVTGERDVFSQEVQRLLQGTESFEAAYIYSNVNEVGKMLDLSVGLPSAVADFMFQTIVIASMGHGAGKMSRLVGCENDGAGPEQDQNGEKTRSRKFLSFGISRIEYPESEIDEYMTYTFAIQAARQLIYNQWQEGLGFGECSIDEIGSYADDIKQNREHFKLSDAYLTLETPIVESNHTNKWKDFNQTWDNRTERDATLVQQEYEKGYWITEFNKLVDHYFLTGFRTSGVKKFYEQQRQEIKAFARRIRKQIEGELFDQWSKSEKKAAKSILQIEKYSMQLRSACSDYIENYNEKISRLEDEKKEHSLAMTDIKNEFDKAVNSPLKDAITKASSKAFASYKTKKSEYYKASTKIEAYRYAISLLQQIVVEFGNMIEGVQAVKNDMIDILTEVVKQAGVRCQSNESSDDALIKRYDPEKVQSLAKQYSINEDTQRENSAAIRTKIINGLGADGERTFVNLYGSMNHDAVSNLILDTCAESARKAMENTATEDPLNKMVGVNILDKLNTELNTPEKLEVFVNQVVNWARPFVEFNPVETKQDLEGKMQSMIQLAIPKAESDSAKGFRNKLIEAFKNKDTSFDERQDVSENYKSNQIVVVCANAGFPLRFLENMRTLKDKYDKLLASPSKDLNRMVLHTESFSKPLPPIFEKDARELLEDVKKPLMLAFAMQLIAPQQNPLTGESFYAMNIPDEFTALSGGANWVQLAKDFTGCLEVLSHDHSKAKQLMGQVEKELQTRARSNDQKAELRKALGAVVQQIILPSVCEGNQFDPKYTEYKNRAIAIFNNELKDL